MSTLKKLTTAVVDINVSDLLTSIAPLNWCTDR